MIFGAYDLGELFQTGLISMSPEKILIHPDWNPSNRRYDADIAALIVEDEVPYTSYIRPICLPTNELNAKEGYVTGWGESEDHTKDHENLPKQIKIPILNNEKCFLESNEFVKVASERTICGGARDNTGPCRGDSGGGLYALKSHVFFLKGLISASLTRNNQCDVTNFALYTNVEKFIEWIENPSEEAVASRPQSKPSYGQTSSSSSPSYGSNNNANVPYGNSNAPSYGGSNKPSYGSANVPPNGGSNVPSYGGSNVVYPGSSNRPSYGSSNVPSHGGGAKPDGSCGIMSSGKSLIQGGSETTREQFPWTVATLVKHSNGNYVYFSTGTLISSKHIVSTGLSVATLDDLSQEYVARRPEDFRMYFGINQMDQTSVSGSLTVDGAAQVILHPNIKHGFPRLANVGILVLKNDVAFNQYISPICLPKVKIDLEEYDGRSAAAVGWGQDDTGSDSNVKNFVIVKIRNQIDCEYFWDESLKRSKSRTFFCAGGDGRKSACYRDQPLYLKNEGRWFFRGLISIAESLPNNKCNLHIPVLYEDIGQYYDWIKSIIN